MICKGSDVCARARDDFEFCRDRESLTHDCILFWVKKFLRKIYYAPSQRTASLHHEALKCISLALVKSYFFCQLICRCDSRKKTSRHHFWIVRETKLLIYTNCIQVECTFFFSDSFLLQLLCRYMFSMYSQLLYNIHIVCNM